ncbi:hypothetical protein [Shewanella sp. AC91-MNA-CIBAN-0169]|jgi:hypothetical protein|uniref:hypothetical protein n=1 Tax=Shewanella TaxID=22 RepID=UPI003333196D
MMNSTTPQFHTILNQEVEYMNGLLIPVLYLNTVDGIKRMESLVNYSIANSDKSISWHRTRVRAIGLFYDFCQCECNISILKGSAPHRTIFRSFSNSLLMGTIDIKSGLDSTKLYWPPSSIAVTKRVCSAITDFISYLNDEGISNSTFLKTESLTTLNNEPASLKFLIQAIIIKKLSFLGHLSSASKLAKKLQDQKHLEIIKHSSSTVTTWSAESAKRFPTDLIGPLFKYGFILDDKSEIPHEREDITAKMITLLLFFSGTRNSEPLHLWFNDVTPDYSGSGLCQVHLRHPSDAKTFIIGEDKLRSQYLAERGLMPRTKGPSKSYKVGWKNLLTDKSLTAPVFFLHSNAQFLFNQMYIYYLTVFRPNLIEVNRNLGRPEHPFLFVSNGVNRATGESYIGSPYSLSAYKKAFTRALDRVENILDIVIPRGLEYGTVPHGGRHFFAGSLADMGIQPKIIQKCLRQRSVLSQGAYTAPTFQRIQDSLNQAKQSMDNTMPALLDNVGITL